MYFQKRCHLNFFLPYGPMLNVNEKEKKMRKKSNIKNFEKQTKND